MADRVKNKVVLMSMAIEIEMLAVLLVFNVKRKLKKK